MSILIKGMEMPKNCMSCPFPAVGVDAYYCHCPTQDGKEYDFKYADTIPDTCPLIELPPHGRLIDADKFEFEMNDKLLVALTEKYGEEEAQKGLHFSFRDCISNIQFQPTVIEAEGSET